MSTQLSHYTYKELACEFYKFIDYREKEITATTAAGRRAVSSTQLGWTPVCRNQVPLMRL